MAGWGVQGSQRTAGPGWHTVQLEWCCTWILCFRGFQATEDTMATEQGVGGHRAAICATGTTQRCPLRIVAKALAGSA